MATRKRTLAPAETPDTEAQVTTGETNLPDGPAEVTQVQKDPHAIEQARSALISMLQGKVDLRTTQRKDVEQRWLDDLRQYHGKYDDKKKADIVKAGGSVEFVNITRSKTNTFAARVADMLLPTDDKNWGLQPTPVPELEEATKNTAALKDERGQPIVTEQGNPVQARDVAMGLKKVAESRCTLMEAEIEDQLAESNYNAVQRDVIDDMALYGTGILKGPVLMNSTKRKWRRVGVDSQGVAQYQIEVLEKTTPGVERVSPWNFFPDMTVTDVRRGEDVLERHPCTRKDLIDLAKLPGFDQDAIRSLVKSGPGKSTLWYLNDLRSISNQEQIDPARTLWEVWEWHGPLDAEQLTAAGVEDVPEDPLLLIEAIVWFCDGQILKAVLNPMDSGDRPYSVCYCEKDDTSIFGYGYPYLLRNPQNVANGAWRMLIDNAGLSVGPQIIVNRKVIEPADGSYALKPRKVWEVTADNVKVDDAFKAVSIDAHQTELLKLFELAIQQADTETNLPLIAQGIDSPDQPDSATGLSIFNNNASVVLRRAVKSYDDDITVPTLTRFYDHNMQNNPKEEIKGDWRVIAKGAGVLMEKERLAQALVKAIEIISKDPEAGVIVDKEVIYDNWFRSLRLESAMRDEDGKAKARKELAERMQMEAQAQAAARGGASREDPQVAAQRLQLEERKIALLERKQDFDERFSVAELAESLGIEEKKVLAALAKVRMTTDAHAREFNASRAFHARTGEAVQ